MYSLALATRGHLGGSLDALATWGHIFGDVGRVNQAVLDAARGLLEEELLPSTFRRFPTPKELFPDRKPDESIELEARELLGDALSVIESARAKFQTDDEIDVDQLVADFVADAILWDGPTAANFSAKLKALTGILAPSFIQIELPEGLDEDDLQAIALILCMMDD